MVVQGEDLVLAGGQEEGGSADSWLGPAAAGLALPALPSLSSVVKYSCLLCWTPREKSSVEEEIKEKEEAIRQRSSEVQVSFSSGRARSSQGSGAPDLMGGEH